MISLLASKSCEQRSKGIEQMWCRASKSARGDGKFAANAATPLQHASAGDSPPTTLLYFTLVNSVRTCLHCFIGPFLRPLDKKPSAF